jgi:hypothetical protein
LSLHIAEFLQSLLECFNARGGSRSRANHQEPNSGNFSRLLCPGGDAEEKNTKSKWKEFSIFHYRLYHVATPNFFLTVIIIREVRC